MTAEPWQQLRAPAWTLVVSSNRVTEDYYEILSQSLKKSSKFWKDNKSASLHYAEKLALIASKEGTQKPNGMFFLDSIETDVNSRVWERVLESNI